MVMAGCHCESSSNQVLGLWVPGSRFARPGTTASPWRRYQHALVAAQIQQALAPFALAVKEGREQDFAAEADCAAGDGNRVATKIEHHDQRFAVRLTTVDQEIA